MSKKKVKKNSIYFQSKEFHSQQIVSKDSEKHEM